MNNAKIWGQFNQIEDSVRPKIRWWIPGAKITAEEMKRELRSIKEAGFGGAEICSMPYVPPTEKAAFDYEVDWGKENWNFLMREVLEEAGRLGLKIDFMMTPGWPLALPGEVDPDDPRQGVQMETDGAHIDGITKEHPYKGKAPIPSIALEDAQKVGGSVKLEGIAVARYVDKEKHLLSYASARVLKKDEEYWCCGEQEYQVVFRPEEEGEYVLFAWWKHPSGARTCGNLQLDHYSKAASDRLIRWWEKFILPSFGEAAKYIDNMFIDSLEYETHLDWTEGLLHAFEARYGYDFTPYLPAVYDEDWVGNFAQVPHMDFTFDEKNEQLCNDFSSLLTDLYVENHLQPIEQFCLKHGMGLRYQTAYGKMLENARTSMYVTVPETESLYGADLLDFYRLQAGAVHMTDKPVYSIETAPETEGRGNGDINSGNYEQGWHNLLWHAHRALVGGVNQLVLHGYSYRGHYEGEESQNGHLPGLIWPGYEGMGSFDSFGNTWGERQPNWIHARQYTDYISRAQYVLRQGKMKVDLAIFAQRYFERIDFLGAERIFDTPILEQVGYTYDYLCPAHFELKNSCVRDGHLAAEGPAYKALIFDQQMTLPYHVAEKTLEFARAGLPIIFIGEIPQKPAFGKEEEIADLMGELLKLKNVYFIKNKEDILSGLKSINIYPDIYPGKTGCFLGVHRAAEEADFYLICNVGNAASYREIHERQKVCEEIRLLGQGSLYRMNPWNGTIEKAASYRQDKDYIVTDLELQENDTCIFAVLKDREIMEELICDEKKGECEKKEFALKDWELTVEAWLPGKVPTENRKMQMPTVHLEKLISWRQIDGLEEISGIGTYRTVFNVTAEKWTKAVLYMPEVHDSYCLKMNGSEVPVNPMSSEVFVGEYLKTGENTLEIQVATTLLNAVIAHSRKHQINGIHQKPDIREWDDYGMIGDVKLMMY